MSGWQVAVEHKSIQVRRYEEALGTKHRNHVKYWVSASIPKARAAKRHKVRSSWLNIAGLPMMYIAADKSTAKTVSI